MLIIVKLFLGLMIVITFAVIVVIFYKLQIVIVTRGEIISVKPFLFSVTRLPFHKIHHVKWRLWEVKAVFFKTMEVHSVDHRIIMIADFEFENFDAIIQIIPHQPSDKKLRIYREQAKMNLWMVYFILGITGIFLLFIVWIVISKGFHLILLLVLGSAVLWMWGGYVRLKRYQRVLG
ncbi:MAG: hypothetical protein HYZ44_11555 [Bacteroidetes bacterium]|nr:hypothetical protein [Bacteroidota bacterium]